jgi:hypothetical protein
MIKIFDFYTTLEIENLVVSVLETQSPTKRGDSNHIRSRSSNGGRITPS